MITDRATWQRAILANVEPEPGVWSLAELADDLSTTPDDLLPAVLHLVERKRLTYQSGRFVALRPQMPDPDSKIGRLLAMITARPGLGPSELVDGASMSTVRAMLSALRSRGLAHSRPVPVGEHPWFPGIDVEETTKTTRMRVVLDFVKEHPGLTGTDIFERTKGSGGYPTIVELRAGLASLQVRGLVHLSGKRPGVWNPGRRR